MYDTVFCIACHSNRKDFRPAYAKLGVLGNYFPQVPIAGLMATANCKTQGIICDSLPFTLFHAQYPNHERQRIITQLASGTSKLRILFVTVAFGIGVDIQSIRQVIHIGVPYTMEEYFQEAGRCGRDGLPSKALVYYMPKIYPGQNPKWLMSCENLLQQANAREKLF